MRKSLTVNSIFNILYKVIASIYPFVATIYVSHVLMAENVGLVSYSQNIASCFAIIAALGLPTYGTKFIAKNQDNEESRSKLFSELFVLNFISTFLCLIVYISLIFIIPKFRDNYLLYSITGLQLVFNFINVDWLYQGMEEYKYIAIRSTLVKIISLICLPIFVRNQSDIYSYAIIYSLAIGANYIFNIIKLKKYVKFSFKNLELKQHLKPILVLLVASLAFEAYSLIDTTMLGLYYNDSVVGCYSNAMKLTRMINTLIAAIGAVLLPRLSLIFETKNQDEFSRLVSTALKIMLFFAIPAAVGIFLLSEPIVLLFFGESFIDSINILKILACLIPFIVCNSLMGIQVLVTIDKEKLYILGVGIGALINCCLNLIFIPMYGAVAAACTSLISEMVVTILYFVFSHKYIKIKINFKFFFSIFLSLTIYVLFFYVLLNNIITNNYVILIVNVSTCIFIYGIINLVLKNEALMICFDKFKKIIKRRD